MSAYKRVDCSYKIKLIYYILSGTLSGHCTSPRISRQQSFPVLCHYRAKNITEPKIHFPSTLFIASQNQTIVSQSFPCLLDTEPKKVLLLWIEILGLDCIIFKPCLCTHLLVPSRCHSLTPSLSAASFLIHLLPHPKKKH